MSIYNYILLFITIMYFKIELHILKTKYLIQSILIDTGIINFTYTKQKISEFDTMYLQN